MFFHPKAAGSAADTETPTTTAPPPAETTEASSQRRPATARPAPKRQPPYAVVVLNDDDHTYDYVIDALQRVCGHDLEQAYLLALQVDLTGRAVVWTGPMETAEFKRDRLRGLGPDTYARRTVTYPLGVVIEPIPG